MKSKAFMEIGSIDCMHISLGGVEFLALEILVTIKKMKVQTWDKMVILKSDAEWSTPKFQRNN